MKFKDSLSYPYLEVSDCGTVRMKDTGEILRALTNHSMSLNGPIVYFRLNGKTRQIGLRGLVYETWVKGERMKKGEFVQVKNDDEDDCRACNLERAGVRKWNKTPTEPTERYSCWMNGGTELFC
jgi:hypothetical protein